jgi:hypothetical protein
MHAASFRLHALLSVHSGLPLHDARPVTLMAVQPLLPVHDASPVPLMALPL